MKLRALTGVLLLNLLGACGSQPDVPLISAARSGNTAAIAALLTQGSDPNLRWGVNGWTPLMHAIHKNQKGSVAVLIAGGADVNARGNGGITALIMAAGYGYADIVVLLLDKGADPYVQTPEGVTALSAAVGGVPDIDKFTVGKCQTDTVAALFKKAPNLKLPDNFYGRAARLAAHASGCGGVLALIERAQPVQQSSHGHV